MLVYTAARGFRVQWPVLEKNASTHSRLFLLLFSLSTPCSNPLKISVRAATGQLTTSQAHRTITTNIALKGLIFFLPLPISDLEYWIADINGVVFGSGQQSWIEVIHRQPEIRTITWRI